MSAGQGSVNLLPVIWLVMPSPSKSADVRERLRCAIDLDNVAIGIKQKELGKTGGAIATDHDSHRVIFRRVFAKTVGNQCGERAMEIFGAEAKWVSAPSTLSARKEPEG